MIRLALPGLVMVLAEYLAFEILTLAASYLSTTHLAAQSILSTITAITFQIPFSTSIAASTRVANLIGATLSDAAKTSARVVCSPLSSLSHLLTYTEHRYCLYCRTVQRGFAIISPISHSSTFYKRPRSYRPCCPSPANMCSIPAF